MVGAPGGAESSRVSDGPADISLFAPLSWSMRALLDRPLCILPDAAATLFDTVGTRPYAGDDVSDDRRPPYVASSGVATIPVHGDLVNRGSWLSRAFGLTSYQDIRSALRQAAADPLVKSIVLDIDSAGGEAAGAAETADEVRALSRLKPVTAYVNSMAASGAYWIASGASEIVATPSATLGSIGVVWLHTDRSKAYAARGVKPTLLHAGAFKVDGNSMEPLEPEAKARIQAQIDDTYDLFVNSVGKHRPALGAAGARETKAAIFMGQKAVDAGLADRLSSSVPLTSRMDAAPRLAVAVASVEHENGQPDSLKETSARIKAILGCEGAKAFPTLAASLAYDSDAPTAEAVARLAAALADLPPPPPKPSRMDFVPRLSELGVTGDVGAVREQRSQADTANMWEQIVAKQNARRPI
jgi:signal peptide peptidase SppA